VLSLVEPARTTRHVASSSALGGCPSCFSWVEPEYGFILSSRSRPLVLTSSMILVHQKYRSAEKVLHFQCQCLWRNRRWKSGLFESGMVPPRVASPENDTPANCSAMVGPMHDVARLVMVQDLQARLKFHKHTQIRTDTNNLAKRIKALEHGGTNLTADASRNSNPSRRPKHGPDTKFAKNNLQATQTLISLQES
jgi:hypothetical protein